MPRNDDPAKPVPNDEKFSPQNVADEEVTTEPPSRSDDKPADTGGRDLPRGSETETRNSSNLRR